MRLIRSIKRIFHIGGPQIELFTRDSQYRPSKWIRGEVCITAPDYRQNVKSITLNLKEFWVENMAGNRNRVVRASRYHQHGSIVIVSDIVLLPRMRYQYPFEIQLPVNCRTSSEESGWRLGVVINSFSSSVKRADFKIRVQLSEALEEIIKAIEKDTKFTEIPEGRKYIPDTSAMRFIFRPPEHLQSKLQYLMLDLSLAEEGGIKGNMRFSLSEGGSSIQFTAGSDAIFSYEFQIEPAQSSGSGGRIDDRAITNIVSDKLAEALDGKTRS